jgi:hypothetical protein
MHQVSLDGLPYFDRIMTADFDLEACSFGKNGLVCDSRGPLRTRVGRVRTALERLRTTKCERSEGKRDQDEA